MLAGMPAKRGGIAMSRLLCCAPAVLVLPALDVILVAKSGLLRACSACLQIRSSRSKLEKLKEGSVRPVTRTEREDVERVRHISMSSMVRDGLESGASLAGGTAWSCCHSSSSAIVLIMTDKLAPGVQPLGEGGRGLLCIALASTLPRQERGCAECSAWCVSCPEVCTSSCLLDRYWLLPAEVWGLHGCLAQAEGHFQGNMVCTKHCVFAEPVAAQAVCCVAVAEWVQSLAKLT